MLNSLHSRLKLKRDLILLPHSETFVNVSEHSNCVATVDAFFNKQQQSNIITIDNEDPVQKILMIYIY